MIGMILTAVFLILLVAASAFFSSSETAILSVSKVQLRQLIKDRIPGDRTEKERLGKRQGVGDNFDRQ